MNWLERLPFIRALRRRQLEVSMQEELQHHIELRTERNVASGMNPAAARKAAELAFGRRSQIDERCRDECGWPLGDRILQDLRFADRQMRRHPSFTAVVLLTFAMGIGATAVIFSLAYAVLLRPLPYPHSEQLVTLGERHLLRGYGRGTSYPDFLDWQAAATSFGAMEANTQALYILKKGTSTERVGAERVTGGYFALLGIKPALGRWLTQADDREGSPRTAVIGHSLWARIFNARPDALGQTVGLDGRDYTVVGVMPSEFASLKDQFFSGDNDPEIWVPWAENAMNSSRNAGPLRAYGRLKTGVTLATAAAEMKAVAQRLATEYPADNENFTVRVGALHADLTSDLRPTLYLLLAAVALLLLITCLNFANLLLVRSTTRLAELSLRAALGAGRGRIMAQMLVESTSISLLGGSLGLALAWISLHVIRFLSPVGAIPWNLAELQWTVTTASLILSVVAGIGFGLAPAVRSSRIDLNGALKSDGARAFSQSRSGHQRSLIVLQVALAFLLLSGVALLQTSVTRLLAVNPGFESKDVLALRTYVVGNTYLTEAKRREYYDSLRTHLLAITGVEEVGAILNLPMGGSRYTNDFDIEGRAKLKGIMNYTDWQVATPEYFTAMKIPLRSGRLFGPMDGENAVRVALINETMAHQFWPDGGAIGSRFRMSGTWYTIVGVVGDVRHIGLSYPPRAESYIPYLQNSWASLIFTLRTKGSPSQYLGQVRSAAIALDPGLPAPDLQPLSELIDATLAGRRVTLRLLAAFALSALSLAVLGLYGTLSYTVARRTRDIGIRVALGSPTRAIHRLVVRQGLTLSIGGLVLGIALSFALGRLLEFQLYNVAATDPATLASVAVVLLGVVTAASWIPAARAARVSPIVALRTE